MSTVLAPQSPQPTAVRPGGRDAAPGPFARALGSAFVVGTLVQMFGVLFDVLPRVTPALLLCLALGCLLLTPSLRLRQARVSVPVALLLAWMTSSLLWSVNPPHTSSLLLMQVPLLLALVAVAGVLPPATLQAALCWTVRLVVGLVVLRLLTDPGSRTSGDLTFDLPGWRGSFVDKNSMAMFLAFGLGVVLSFDRSRLRWPTVVVMVVLLAGSQSVTGISGSVLAVTVWGWLQLLARRRPENRGRFVAGSVVLAVAAAVTAVVNATALLEVAGRDADLTGRTEIWAAVADKVQERPLTGYGIGGLLAPDQPSQVTLDIWRQIGFGAVHAHNGVLDLVGQLGVIGLVVYAWALLTTVVLAVQNLRVARTSATAALVVVSAQLLISLTENVYLGPWLAVLVLLQTPLLQATAHRSDAVGARPLGGQLP